MGRFEHCLGVAHLAGKFVKHLRVQHPRDITDKDVLCVQVAGLCHDLGHGVYSHLWESFIHKQRQIKWHHEETSAQMLQHLLDENDIFIGDYGLDQTDLIFIKEMITGHCDDRTKEPISWPFKGRPAEKQFLYQIVNNTRNGIDVDKWDYFRRDSHNLGLTVSVLFE